MREAIRRHAAAKINLALHVTGRRDDGYHTIETLAVFTEFGDSISVAPTDEDRFAVTGPFADGTPDDTGNLVLRAREALRAAIGPDKAFPVAITLEKNMPPAAGIGGGSSDAAAALAALAELWGVGDDDRLERIALDLGADVPMCRRQRPLIARGIGEAIAELSPFPPLNLVLVNPGVAVSTASVFGALARRDNAPLPPPAFHDFNALAGWLAETRNDLEPPARAMVPEIGGALAALADTGAALVRMSGSGATCFGLFATHDAAATAAKAIARSRPGWFCVATQSRS